MILQKIFLKCLLEYQFDKSLLIIFLSAAVFETHIAVLLLCVALP